LEGWVSCPTCVAFNGHLFLQLAFAAANEAVSPVVLRQWLWKETPLPHSPQHSEDSKRPASEFAEQACEEMVENLKTNVAERRKVLAELAAYDQEIGI
jgi:hypothetical protein